MKKVFIYGGIALAAAAVVFFVMKHKGTITTLNLTGAAAPPPGAEF